MNRIFERIRMWWKKKNRPIMWCLHCKNNASCKKEVLYTGAGGILGHDKFVEAEIEMAETCKKYKPKSWAFDGKDVKIKWDKQLKRNVPINWDYNKSFWEDNKELRICEIALVITIIIGIFIYFGGV